MSLSSVGLLTIADDLIIGDGKTIGSASDPDAITIASNGQLTLTQTLIGTALDISGDIDVDGTTNLDVVDIDGAVDMASTLQVDGVITTSDGMIITTADNTDTLTLISTDADAASGPNLRLRRDSSSPADDDDLGHIFFSGEDAAGNETNYITFDVITKTVADGSENGLLQIKTMSAGTLLELAAFQADGIIFNERSNDLNFRVESNGNANMFVVDGGLNTTSIGGAADTNATLLIHTTTTTDNTGLTIKGAVSGDGARLAIADAGSNLGNRAETLEIGYDSSTDFIFSRTGQDLIIGTGSAETFRISSAGRIATGAESGPDCDAGGITLDQNDQDNHILTFKSSDVAHGITNNAETDTYAEFQKNHATVGGVKMLGYSSGESALQLDAQYTTGNSTKGTGATCPLQLNIRKKSGTATASPASNDNMFSVTNNGQTKFIVDAEGELHSDGGAQSAYDTYEDAHLVRAYDLSHGKGVIDSKFDKFVSYNHEKLADMKLVGREEDGTPNNFVNVTGMQRLHNGAIWQQYEKTEKLTMAMYELAKETIGEEKAKKILEKHEVKLLS